ncbi:C39 family peptidase [Bradyrhizobium sp. SZCCHNRI1058]|uniref:C39 family peptidase n=1 Tax=Bradyrhizobium sp. SZCCHNRI1058 TaxID=3057279 RepID=UPI002915FDD0|nr:papain-like cysteine protease family protein [Bradyrhizobium sp. SZCCHNRI1058]
MIALIRSALALCVLLFQAAYASSAEWPNSAVTSEWPNAKSADWPSAKKALGVGSQAHVLSINPQIQQSPVWCWAAVSGMIFDWYGVPNVNPAGIWQCGVVGAMAKLGGIAACYFDCKQCDVPAGSAEHLRFVLQSYPKVAKSKTSISATVLKSPLDKKAIVELIDGERPIVAGINPGSPEKHFGSAEHVALIVGYRDLGNYLVVNDPFPFWERGMSPYEDAGGVQRKVGQYLIRYDDFLKGIGWSETLTIE